MKPGQTISSPSVVADLRRRTARAHSALETSDLVLPATRDSARYARLIGAMLSFHRALEREFIRFESVWAARGITMEWRYKTALLIEESLQVASPDVGEPHLRYDSAAHAAGALYVMEGSTLGGMLIAKSVETHLHHASRYYGAYGSQTASRWRTTVAQLDAFAIDASDREEMCAGAEATFAALHEHLAGARSG